MKKYNVSVIAAILGSALTILIFFALGLNEPEEVTVRHIPDDAPAGVLYTMDQQGQPVPLDFTEIANQVMDVVVHISSTVQMQQGSMDNYQQLPDPFRDFFRRYYDQQNPNGPQQQQRQPQERTGSGSGVIINSEGYIVTNNHVVADASRVEVALHDNRTYEAQVIGTDPTTDLALIKIDETGLPSIRIVNSDDVLVGQWVLAVGNPFNLNSTVTAGIVSAKSRSINILREDYAIESFIQTDAAINPGNSGGALVNMQGGLIGINTAIASPTGSYSGYGFAVPSNIVNKVVSDLLEYGSVQRGILGVQINNMTQELADEENLDFTEGVFIDSVLSGSAAEDAGLQEGDVVVAVNGNVVTMASQLQELIARQRPGDEVEITVMRDGERIDRTATLLSIEGTTELASAESRGIMQSTLGAELSALSDEEASELDVEGGVRITRLYAGKLRSETNIREGFIILRVNSEPVESVDELNDILDETSGGVMLEGFYEDEDELRYYAFGL